jgi:hypothetical protein
MECWKSIDLILPDTLSAADVRAHAHAQIRIAASEAGEFVQQIRVERSVPHREGCTKWTATYLTGPPAAFPI